MPSDNFDRANGTLGANWTVFENMAGGGGQIISMAFAPAQASTWHEGAFWNANVIGENQYSQGRRVTTGLYVAVAVRCKVGTAGRGYWYAWFNHGPLQKGENGTVTTLATISSYAANDVAKITVVGNVIEVFKNGVSQGTYTDTGTALPTGGQPGLLVFNMGDGCRIDDWQGDVASASAGAFTGVEPWQRVMNMAAADQVHQRWVEAFQPPFEMWQKRVVVGYGEPWQRMKVTAIGEPWQRRET